MPGGPALPQKNESVTLLYKAKPPTTTMGVPLLFPSDYRCIPTSFYTKHQLDQNMHLKISALCFLSPESNERKKKSCSHAAKSRMKEKPLHSSVSSIARRWAMKTSDRLLGLCGVRGMKRLYRRDGELQEGWGGCSCRPATGDASKDDVPVHRACPSWITKVTSSSFAEGVIHKYESHLQSWSTSCSVAVTRCPSIVLERGDGHVKEGEYIHRGTWSWWK